MKTEICFDCYKIMEKREEIIENNCRVYWICESCGKRKYEQLKTNQMGYQERLFPNILGLTTIDMKYCHDCLTPISRNSSEEYCSFCKRDRESKKAVNPTA